MTAEVAILNRQAVAIAADSAVTAQTDSGGHKIFNSANKLFMLSKHHPVAVMVYGSAYFRGVPWETIVKEYRQKLGGRHFDYVEDYMDDFRKFFQKEKRISGEKSQELYVRETASRLVGMVRNRIKEAIQEKFQNTPSEELPLTEIGEVVSETCVGLLAFCKSQELIKKLKGVKKQDFIDTYEHAIVTVATDMLENLPLKKKDKNNIVSSVFEWLRRCHQSAGNSGVVVAGFGEVQLFPSLSSCLVDGVFLGKLRCIEQDTRSIDSGMDATIVPFAQADVIMSFVEGADPNYRKTLEVYLDKVFSSYPNELLEALPLREDVDENKLKKKLNEVGSAMLADLSDKMAQFRQEHHISPLLTTAAGLPKDELAEVAETLVQLTSFRRKFSQDSETVGGPVDVAVISKGDGFVWVKRKHYFDIEKNIHFRQNYYEPKK